MVSFIESISLPRPVAIKVVSEQGASIYSASDVAREEFPDLDVTLRGAISIGRRLLDPMAELVEDRAPIDRRGAVSSTMSIRQLSATHSTSRSRAASMLWGSMSTLPPASSSWLCERHRPQTCRNI